MAAPEINPERVGRWQEYGDVRPRVCATHGVQHDGVTVYNVEKRFHSRWLCASCVTDLITKSDLPNL